LRLRCAVGRWSARASDGRELRRRTAPGAVSLHFRRRLRLSCAPDCHEPTLPPACRFVMTMLLAAYRLHGKRVGDVGTRFDSWLVSCHGRSCQYVLPCTVKATTTIEMHNVLDSLLSRVREAPAVNAMEHSPLRPSSRTRMCRRTTGSSHFHCLCARRLSERSYAIT